MIEEISHRLSAYKARQLDASGWQEAAVLLPLYRLDEELHVVLTRRTDRVEHHKGQISFPGGVRDLADADLMATALRESDEEIGLLAGHVRLMGRLDDVVTGSRFHITAFVGEIDPQRSPYRWRRQETEVAEILEVPLGHLLEHQNQIEVPSQRDGELVVQQGYRFGDHVIWGATARMLRNFIEVAVLSETSPSAGKRV